MSSEGDGSSSSVPVRRSEVAAWSIMVLGAAFLPGLMIALCVVVIVVIAHLVG